MEKRDSICRMVQLGCSTKSWQEEGRQVIVDWLRRVIMLMVVPLCKGRMLMKACCVVSGCSDDDLLLEKEFWGFCLLQDVWRLSHALNDNDDPLWRLSKLIIISCQRKDNEDCLLILLAGCGWRDVEHRKGANSDLLPSFRMLMVCFVETRCWWWSFSQGLDAVKVCCLEQICWDDQMVRTRMNESPCPGC